METSYLFYRVLFLSILYHLSDRGINVHVKGTNIHIKSLYTDSVYWHLALIIIHVTDSKKKGENMEEVG